MSVCVCQCGCACCGVRTTSNIHVQLSDVSLKIISKVISESSKWLVKITCYLRIVFVLNTISILLVLYDKVHLLTAISPFSLSFFILRFLNYPDSAMFLWEI